MSSGTGPRLFDKRKFVEVFEAQHPCQSCADESQAYRLRLLKSPVPDRVIYLCKHCVPRYENAANARHGAVSLQPIRRPA